MNVTIEKYVREIETFTIGKLLTIVGVSGFAAGAKLFVERWLFEDWNFLAYLAIFVALDLTTGVAKALKQRDFSSSALGIGILMKLVMYPVVLIVIHGLMNFQIGGQHPDFTGYLDDVGLSALMLREAVSIMENVAALAPNLLPKGILKRLRDFDSESGELKAKEPKTE